MSELPLNWVPTAFIKDVSILQSGYGFPIEYQGKSEGEIGFYKVGDISRNWQAGRISLSQAAHYISAEESVELGAKLMGRLVKMSGRMKSLYFGASFAPRM